MKLSLGTSCKYSLECLHYNVRVTARVRASNRAGEGPFSPDVTIYTDKGKIVKASSVGKQISDVTLLFNAAYFQL